MTRALVFASLLAALSCAPGEPPAGATRASPSEENDEDPAILALATGDVLLVWYSEASGKSDLWQARSTDGGESFDEPRVVFDSPERDYYPTLTQTDDGRVHLAWQRIDGSAYPDVFYASSDDDGASWSAPVNLTGDLQTLDWAPMLASRGDELALAFSSERTGRRQLFVTTSTDSGTTWDSPRQVTFDDRFDDFASIALGSDGSVALAWTRFESDEESPPNPTPSARLVLAEAATIGELSDATPRAFAETDDAMDAFPWLYEVDDALHVAWTSTRTGDGFGDIVSAPLGDDGDITRLTEGDYPDYTARFTVAPDAVLFAWVVDTARNNLRDIYVKRLAR